VIVSRHEGSPAVRPCGWCRARVARRRRMRPRWQHGAMKVPFHPACRPRLPALASRLRMSPSNGWARQNRTHGRGRPFLASSVAFAGSRTLATIRSAGMRLIRSAGLTRPAAASSRWPVSQGRVGYLLQVVAGGAAGGLDGDTVRHGHDVARKQSGIGTRG